MKPNYDKLYYFTENFSRFASGMRVGPSEPPSHEYASWLRGSCRPHIPIRYDRRSGSQLRDVIWTTISDPLVSEDFLSVLIREKFTGWSTYPIVVYEKDGIKLSGFGGLVVTGRAGAIDPSRTHIELRDPIGDGMLKSEWAIGLYFKSDEWDGSDIFLPADRNYIIVTERVKEALKDLDIKNVKFVRLTEFAYRPMIESERKRYPPMT